MRKYDICIIGAGPCGLISALELSKKFKVCIIDAGRDLENRKCFLNEFGKCDRNCNPCNIITGYGGCQFIDGTKVCFYPAGSGLFNFGEKEEIINYYNYIENLLVSFGKPSRKKENQEKIRKIIEDFKKQDINVKYYNAQKVDKEIMKIIGINIRNRLKENNVDFYYNEMVEEIKKEKDFIIYAKNMVFQANKVILATGRYGGVILK